MKLGFDKSSLQILKLEGRSAGNIVLLILYQAIAVWPVVAALLLLYLMEPEIELVSKVSQIVMDFGISLESYIANILGTFTLTGLIIIGLIYIIATPILEIRQFPKTISGGLNLLVVFLLNFLIVFIFGGKDSLKEAVIAYGFMNFLSFFLLFLIIYFKSIPSVYLAIMRKIGKQSLKQAVKATITLVLFSIIFVVSFIMTFLLGLKISGTEGLGIIYFVLAVTILAVVVFKNTDSLEAKARQRDYELTGRRGPRKL